MPNNGSNFIKPCQFCGELDENNNAEPLERAKPNQIGEGENTEEEEERGENIVGVEFVEAGTMLDEDDGQEYQLPKQHCCACHLLNLEANANTFSIRGSLSFSVFQSTGLSGTRAVDTPQLHR